MIRWPWFARVGDEWVVAYAGLESTLLSVHPFVAGHAAELYLKAARLKQEPEEDIAGAGHNLQKLLDRCADADERFPQQYRLRPLVLERLAEPMSIPDSADSDDTRHYLLCQELYQAAVWLKDFKYGPAYRRPELAPGSLVFIYPSEFWRGFFQDMRSYLDPRPQGGRDPIIEALTSGALPLRARVYLLSVLGPATPTADPRHGLTAPSVD